MPKIVRHYGEPFADPSAIPCFYLAELTRSQVTVALNGDGGDESFGGYTRYVANRLGGAARPASGAASSRDRGAGRARSAAASIASVSNKARRLMEGLAARSCSAATSSYMAWLDRRGRPRLYTDEFAAVVASSPDPEIIARAVAGGLRRRRAST